MVLTCDALDRPTLERVVASKIEVNAGSIDMLHQLGERSPGHRVWIRINPGFGHGHSRKTNTGGENSKHGIWHEELDEALACIKAHGLHLVGVHMHIGSGVDYQHLEQVARSMIELIGRLGVDIEAFSIGGGLSTPYRSTDKPVDLQRYAQTWAVARKEIEAMLGHPVRMEIEPGRFLVAESGYLVAEVRAVKQVGRNTFVIIDAGFNDLMRPAMYGAYHGMTLLDADGQAVDRPRQPTVVAGPLCESGDVFTQDDQALTPQDLPQAQVGDLLVIHDAGAYGASMSSNYNSRPLLPEFLIENGALRMIHAAADGAGPAEPGGGFLKIAPGRAHSFAGTPASNWPSPPASSPGTLKLGEIGPLCGPVSMRHRIKKSDQGGSAPDSPGATRGRWVDVKGDEKPANVNDTA